MRDAAAAAPVTPVNLELVTLTEDRAIFTWYTGATGSEDDLGRMEPEPAGAEIIWGTEPNRLDRLADSERTDTPYHRVELTGLEPGRTYYYRARSDGRYAVPTELTMTDGDAVNSDGVRIDDDEPFQFTTPQPPPGRFLYSVVLCNDLHLGETTAGLVGDIPGIQGIQQIPGERPYPVIMTEALLADVDALGASYLLAAGDLTAEARPDEVAQSRELLERFGSQGTDWFATRGNHDRAHDGDEYTSCPVGDWQGHDCFAGGYFPSDTETWLTTDFNGLRIIGIDTYDKPGGGGDAGALRPEQMDWFRTTLAENPEQPTIVFGHHPLVVEASPYPDSDGDRLDADQADEIIALYRDTPGVFLHHAGHTHRNHRSEIDGLPGVVHQEVAAAKEYPGGFTLLRVHEGGYALNFHKSTSDEARAWSERSRMQIGGSWPQFSLGSRVSDRNVVVEQDLSGVGAPAAAAALSTDAGVGRGSGGSGGSGATVALVAGGSAVAAAAAGTAYAVHRLRSREEDDHDEPDPQPA